MSSMPSLSDAWRDGPCLPLPNAVPSPLAARLADWLAARPVRVTLLLGAVWLLNGFDLIFTLVACRLGCFIELNPIAARVLGDDNFAGIIIFKCALVGCGSAILYWFRGYRVTELSCWLLACVYSGLAVRWHRYYEVFSYHYYHG